MLRVRNDTTYTKQDGSYSFRQDLFEASDMVVKVKFEDIDSTANGEYESANTTLRISKEDFKGGHGRWFRGETKQTVDMKLNDFKLSVSLFLSISLSFLGL